MSRRWIMVALGVLAAVAAILAFRFARQVQGGDLPRPQPEAVRT